MSSGKDVPLVGNAFLDKWTDQAMAGVEFRNHVQTARVLAYILSVNKFQAGQKPLPADPDGLSLIHIAKP